MTDADPQGGRQASAGAAVRFPVPPLLFAAPLAAGPRPGPLGAALAAARGGSPWNPRRRSRDCRRRSVVQSLRRADRSASRHDSRTAPRGSRLVTTGPFQLTRNPMYTGHVVVLLGAALRTGSWWPLLVAPLCVRATTRLVILPEEEYLTRQFGDDYQRYRARVRRWI